MPDFPGRGSYGRTTSAISCSSADTPLGEFLRYTGIGTASTAYTTANTALYMPFTVQWPYLAQKMGVQVTTQSGNMDVGIYDEKGNRLVSMGSTGVAAAGLQVFNIADTWLMPGTYFMAINVDNTTAAFTSYTAANISSNTGRTCGLQMQAVGAVTLPNPATFATYTPKAIPSVLITGATL